MKKFMALFLGAFWINMITAQESKLPVFITDSLEKYISNWMSKWEIPGFNSSFMIVPEDNLGVVILTNSDFNNFYDDLRGEILNAFFDIPYQGLTERSY